MRGKETLDKLGKALTGITPAHAGKRISSIIVLCNDKDHPRPCGEKYLLVSMYLDHKGSPPPMRGKVIVYLKYPLVFRITPAHAGKS